MLWALTASEKAKQQSSYLQEDKGHVSELNNPKACSTSDFLLENHSSSSMSRNSSKCSSLLTTLNAIQSRHQQANSSKFLMKLRTERCWYWLIVRTTQKQCNSSRRTITLVETQILSFSLHRGCCLLSICRARYIWSQGVKSVWHQVVTEPF